MTATRNDCGESRVGGEPFEAAFPRYELLSEEIVGEREVVVVRADFRVAHRGPFAGIEPSGKSVSAGLIIIYNVQNRKS